MMVIMMIISREKNWTNIRHPARDAKKNRIRPAYNVVTPLTLAVAVVHEYIPTAL